MISFRGDAHKLYIQLKKAANLKQPLQQMKELKELEEIQHFYQSIDTALLKQIYYRMLKEKSGSGIIPIFVSSVPWLLFLFSTRLQKFLFTKGAMLWVSFSLIYLIVLTISVILHFREKAWADVHFEIVKDILKER